MSAIYFLIACSVSIALFFLYAFFWANRNGQHEDSYTPALRILFDDEHPKADAEQREDDQTTSAKK